MVCRRAFLVNQINRICHDDSKQGQECFRRLDQAPIQHLILFVGNVRQECAARFNESVKIVNVHRMRLDPDADAGKFALEHPTGNHCGDGHGKSGLPIPRQQETDRACTCQRQIADHRLWETAGSLRLWRCDRLVIDDAVINVLCPLQPFADVLDRLLIRLPDNAQCGIGFSVMIDRDDHASVCDEIHVPDAG